MRKIYALILAATMVTGCTWSFQQIDTHGTATDVLDEEVIPTISPDLDIPIGALAYQL